VNDADDLVDDPQVTGRGSLVTLDGTDTRVLANPLRFDRAPGDRASHATSTPPDLGGDTDAVLGEAGFSDDERAALRASSVIA
jgi:crotonobetainyl-CoA:carnitine CoA-transferase CaiB-like acyl-CoA transferase